MPSGQFVLLDSRLNEIRVYSAEGRLLGRTGRPGRGPGELYQPSAVAVSTQQEIFVSDAYFLHVFGWGGDSLRYHETLRLPVFAIDVCILSDTLFVHGMDQVAGGKIIHRVSREGELIQSFGEVYQVVEPRMAFTLRRGRIACAERGSLVAFAPTYLPYIQAWASDGTPKWVTAFPDWLVFEMEEARDHTSLSTIVPEQGAHVPVRFVAVEGGTSLVVDLALKTRNSLRDKAEFASIDRYILRALDGTGFYVGSTDQFFLLSTERAVLTAQHDPFPRALVYSFLGGQ